MLIAFILMQQFGVSANLMSLAGLAIGTGMMVDGAVVMVENVFQAALACAGVGQADQQDAAMSFWKRRARWSTRSRLRS